MAAKIRRGHYSKKAGYGLRCSLPVPRDIAEAFSEEQYFEAERTNAGILFRAVRDRGKRSDAR